jgi:predicted negative regulator of RcsB-dependent stress response
VLGRLAQASSELAMKYRAPAIAALTKFAQDHPTGWQIAPALMTLAQLQEDTGDLAAVHKTYEALSAVPGLSDEIRTTSSLNAARTLMKLEKFDDARAKLTTLKQQLGDSPLAGKVQIYLAQCQIMGTDPKEAEQAEKQLREMLGTSEDKSFKALAHNTLGDYYTKLKRDEDAFWEYLRVDTLYSDDRFEHSRAMYHLIRLFREVKKDPDRSDQYLETLKDPKFAGEYQKKATKK